MDGRQQFMPGYSSSVFGKRCAIQHEQQQHPELQHRIEGEPFGLAAVVRGERRGQISAEQLEIDRGDALLQQIVPRRRSRRRSCTPQKPVWPDVSAAPPLRVAQQQADHHPGHATRGFRRCPRGSKQNLTFLQPAAYNS